MNAYFSLDNSLSEEQSLPVQIAQVLLRKIFMGELKLGTRITEASIAKQLNVSNIPVREAFSILHHTGIIEKIPHKGVHIREITKKEIRDYEITLNILYKKCIDLADSKWSREKLNLMKDALVDLKHHLDSNNLIEFVNAYAKICRYVIVVSENVAILRFYDEITYVTNAYVQSHWNDINHLRKLYEQLVSMIEELCKGNNEEAKHYFEEMTCNFLNVSK